MFAQRILEYSQSKTFGNEAYTEFGAPDHVARVRNFYKKRFEGQKTKNTLILSFPC